MALGNSLYQFRQLERRPDCFRNQNLAIRDGDFHLLTHGDLDQFEYLIG